MPNTHIQMEVSVLVTGFEGRSDEGRDGKRAHAGFFHLDSLNTLTER